jgi:hypothetical protein
VQFMVQIQKQELERQWTWAPAMAEGLILLLVDPNDVSDFFFNFHNFTFVSCENF